ncbi:MAG: efflux RND transporter permease subunit [Pirellulaceae bacterium]
MSVEAPSGDARESTPIMTRVVEVFLRGDVAILFVIVSLMLGGAALLLTPREEEPQIVVPMADVFVSAPGLSAAEVEQQVTRRLEKLLYQIDGVEYVYSMSRPEQSIVTVRFFVNEDREDSLVKLYNKINSNTDQIPPVVTSWVVKPIEIDDVPIVIATLWTDRTQEMATTTCGGSLKRYKMNCRRSPIRIRSGSQAVDLDAFRVELDPQRLAARQTSPLQLASALRAGNVMQTIGQFEQQDR